MATLVEFESGALDGGYWESIMKRVVGDGNSVGATFVPLRAFDLSLESISVVRGRQEDRGALGVSSAR
jgi:hypothetical protein